MTKARSSRTKRETEIQASVSPAPVLPRTRASVFVSHDSRDADLAEAFGNLLMDASGGMLKSFRSSDRKGTAGIEFGAEWYSAIMTSLKDATDVVALLTQHSVNRPWLLYEAGVAKGKLDTTVFGVAIGIPLEQASTGPFAQFQNCGDDEDSLTKLALQLIRRNPEAAPREEAVRLQVRAFRDSVPRILKSRGKPSAAPDQSKVDETAVVKLFEEIKIMFGTLPEKLEEKFRESMRPKGLLRRGFHPMMLDELLSHPGLREAPGGIATGWLLLISALRDDMPWLYEVGMEVYRALCSEDTGQIDTARKKLRAVLDVSMQSRGMRHLLSDDMESHMMLRHLPDMLDHYLREIPNRRRPRPSPEKGPEQKS
jgi:hypothetical protein